MTGTDKYWLIDDEAVTISVGKRTRTARVRVWRRKDRPAIVLIEPWFYDNELEYDEEDAARYATAAWRDLLRFDERGMHAYIGAPCRSGHKYHLYRATFRLIGYGDKRRLHDPELRPAAVADLAGDVGPFLPEANLPSSRAA